MSYNRFLELLLRKKSAELSANEELELNRFLSDNPDFLELSDIVDQLYDAPLREVNEIDNTYLKKKWNELKYKTVRLQSKLGFVELSRRVVQSKYFYIAAASVAIVLLIGLFYYYSFERLNSKDIVVSTEMGTQTKMKLPDGSTIWLNVGSQLSYNKNFGKLNREVRLSGEAFFDVAHDINHPFIVHTENFKIKVLGTTFNVKTYHSDKESEATLIRGSIELSINDEEDTKLILKPNEKLIFRISDENKKGVGGEKKNTLQEEGVRHEIRITGLQKPFNDSATVETQWLNDCFAFRDHTLKDIASMIYRWYGVSVEINDKELEEKRFSGIFKEESVEQVMDALKIAGGFHYYINKNKVTIFP